MKNNVKKLISTFLAALMLFSMIPLSASAAESTPTVEIISFMRGEQDNLRSSELLEAHIEGYDGNVQELTYKWKSTLGTYLYVYNSHNMYNINNTDGEIEIHNTDKNMAGLSNMVGRTYNKEFAGVGYAWASVYGASIKASTSLVGTVTVEVYDKNGNLLCYDSHEGKYSNRKNTGFVTYNLDADMDNVVLGLFEGDKRNVKDLLGESAVVHITCVESTVSKGTIIAGAEHVKLTKENGDYYITGTVAGTSTDSKGDAQVDLDITKGNCKFHNGTSGDAVTTVFVFKKPTTSTTTTTLTLTGNLDDRCDYFIGGVEGIKQADGTIIFTGLTPNTNYTVEVRGEYKDNNGTTKYSYAYVYDTTKPVYKATVNTYLNGVKTDIADIHGEDVTLYLHEKDNKVANVQLQRTEKGTYTATVENGIYYPWHIEAGDHEHMAREYKLIIENANGELNLHHYSVTYNANGGTFTDGTNTATEIYSSMAKVDATDNIPKREGYVFAGWEYGGKTYNAGEEIESAISSAIELNAKWEKKVNVTINVTIDHMYQGGYDHSENKDELVIDFLEMKKGSEAFIETGDKLIFSKEGVTDENGNSKAYEHSEIMSAEAVKTKYTATAVTYSGLLETSTFGVALIKSGYDIGTVEKIKDANGDWTINVPLKYNPDDFDIEFSVKMDKDVPQELYPDAVIVKLAYWDTAKNEWVIISQQRTTENAIRPGVRVDIDPATGEGAGSYPVWKHEAENVPYGYRAVVTGFIYNNSTVIIPTEKDHTKENGLVIVTYTDGNYTATMGDIADGKKFSTSLNGAYYDDATNAQKGTLDGVITVEKYDVTFDAQGGEIKGEDKYTAAGQYYVPEFKDYVPTMEGHEFKGWYLDAACTIPATERELLVKDITLYAEWDRVLTGTLIVDGYYKVDGNQYVVNDADRATHALIELEEITPDGTYNIDGKTVEIDWTADEHFSNPVAYKFTGLDPDKTYRIAVYLMNYHVAYQNATTVLDDDTKDDIHDDYNATDFTAVYSEGELETFVNVFLDFKPEVYFQDVVVDATKIGEGFRPTDALVEYLGKDVGTDADYSVIVQHEVEPFGVEVAMGADGKNAGTFGEKIWKENFNGNLYDYQANLKKLSGEDLAQWPVYAVYGDSVRWSPYNQAPTDSLKVTLIPMWYSVTYDWNTGDGYKEIDSMGHTWSYASALNYNTPVREGYVFKGWYSNPECTGEAIESIAADVHEDTTLYAKWEERTDLAITVYHVEKENPDNILAVETIGGQTFGSSVQAVTFKENFSDYDYVGASAQSVTVDNDNTKNVITLYYSLKSVEYIVKHYKADANGNYTESHVEIEEFSGKVGDFVQAVPKNYEHYCLNRSKNEETIGILKASGETLVLKLYYDFDSLGGGKNGNDGDGIPDKYQKRVEFEVVNGTWSDGNANDIVKYVTLTTAGKWDENGSAKVELPSGMIPYEGYANGKWNVVADKTVTVNGTDLVRYTYTFAEIPVIDPENPDVDIEGDGDIDGDGSVDGDTKHTIVFGKTNAIGWYNVSLDGGETYQIAFGNSTLDVDIGTEIIVKASNPINGAFTFYVNGDAVKPDENGCIKVLVDGPVLIGALSVEIEVPDTEESLNLFQKIIKAIKDFFAKIFSWFK